LIRLALTILIVMLVVPTSLSFADRVDGDDSYSFSQKIVIPFDTSVEGAHFQPIDIHITFSDPCWAKNEKEHSVRVCCWDGTRRHELESQIYSLERTTDMLISGCNLVFLIPEYARGSEEYVVFYDDHEKAAPNYSDHVSIEESYYHFEPIPGYPLESQYYKILDDSFVTYIISLDGQFMGYNTCQHVTKMNPGTTEVLPKNGDLFAAFDFKYCYEEGLFGYSSTSQKLVFHDVLVDGPLMLECRVVSTSKFDDLQTTAVYKYYHNPGDTSRIYTHVKHEALTDIDVYPEAKMDGAYASLQSGGVKSKSLRDLNFGEILPFMHFINEQGTLSEYSLDTDPEYIPDDPDIRILRIQDDVELGTKPWISFDEGQTGRSHSIIFTTNDVLVRGENEQNGFQLNAFEMDYPHLPGLENNIATMQVCRNSFEKNIHDLTIPQDFMVEFDAEFFSTEKGGYTTIQQEADIFEDLVSQKPVIDDDNTEDTEEIQKHNLSITAHYAPSAPMGSGLSALFGLNISYINIELYKDNNFLYSGNAVRLPMNPLTDSESLQFIKKIVATLEIFDIKNISLFKKAVFTGLEQGRYVIKIYLENPLFSNERYFIGYDIVDLQQDETVHALCRSEEKFRLTLIDQNNDSVNNAEVHLQKNNTTISYQITDTNGEAVLTVPTSPSPYDLTVVYNGYVVYREPVLLNAFHTILPQEKHLTLTRHMLTVHILDTWGYPLGVQITPIVTLPKFTESPMIYGMMHDEGTYIFANLTQGTYLLDITYKRFSLIQNIDLSSDKNIHLEFPAEYLLEFDIQDARGMPYSGSDIVLTHDSKTDLDVHTQDGSILVPPGSYRIFIYNDDEMVGARNITLYGDQKYTVITNHQPLYPTLIMTAGICLLALFVILVCIKKNHAIFYLCIPLSLLFISLVAPWWGIQGSTEHLETSTNLYLLPVKLITVTSTENTIAGEPSYLPQEFHLAITLILLFTLIGSSFLILDTALRNRIKKTVFQLVKPLGLMGIIGSFIAFLVAYNEVCRVSVGSLVGKGYLDIGAVGESQTYAVSSTWGFQWGFYLYLIAIVLLLLPQIISLLKTHGGAKKT